MKWRVGGAIAADHGPLCSLSLPARCFTPRVTHLPAQPKRADARSRRAAPPLLAWPGRLRGACGVRVVGAVGVVVDRVRDACSVAGGNGR